VINLKQVFRNLNEKWKGVVMGWIAAHINTLIENHERRWGP
jgi:hypothetical protein